MYLRLIFVVSLIGGCSHGPRYYIPSSARNLPQDQLAKLDIHRKAKGLRVDGHKIGIQYDRQYPTVLVLPGPHTISFKVRTRTETSADRRIRELRADGYTMDLDTFLKSARGRGFTIYATGPTTSFIAPNIGPRFIEQYTKEGEEPVRIKRSSREEWRAIKWVSRDIEFQAKAGNTYKLRDSRKTGDSLTPITPKDASCWKLTEVDGEAKPKAKDQK